MTRAQVSAVQWLCVGVAWSAVAIIFLVDKALAPEPAALEVPQAPVAATGATEEAAP